MTGAGFLAWWRAELAGMVPARLRAAAGPARALLLAAPEPGGVALTLWSGRVATALGALHGLAPARLRGLVRDARAGRLQVALAVPEGVAAVRRVELPLAAAADLHAVVGFEMDRLTPFAAAEVFYAAAPLGRRPRQDRLDVALTFVVRAPFAAAEAALAAAGLPAARAELLDAAGAPAGALRPAGPPPPARAAWPGRLARAGVLAAALAGAAWAWADLAALDRRAAALGAEAAALRRAAFAAQDLRAAAAAADLDARALARRRAAPSVADALDALAEALPDDAWATSLRLEGRSLEIAGLARDAGGLIRLFADDPRFAAPELAAPILREPGADRERFVLRLRLAESAP